MVGKLVSLLLLLPVAGCAIIDGLTGDGGGPFPLDFTLGIETNHHAVAADFNGDGLADLAVTQPSTQEVRIFLSKDGHRFSTDYDRANEQGSCDPESRLWAVEVDGDAAAELLVVNTTGDPIVSHLTIYENQVSPGRVQSVDLEGTVHAITSGGFAGGGALVVATQGPDRLVLVRPDFDGEPTVTTIRELTAAETGISSVVAASLDLDGYLDLAYGHEGGASLMYGKADGSFTDPRLIDLGPVTQVAAADMAPGDADELVVLGTSTTLDVWAVQVVTISDDQVVGGFGMDGMTWPAVQLGLGNLDGSLPPDVVVLPGGDRAPELAFGFTAGTGGSGFVSYLEPFMDPLPERLLVADFSGDGRDDLIAVGSGKVKGYRNALGGTPPPVTRAHRR